MRVKVRRIKNIARVIKPRKRKVLVSEETEGMGRKEGMTAG